MIKIIKNSILFLLVFFVTQLAAQEVAVDAVIDTTKLRIGEPAKVDLYLSYSAKKALKITWPTIGDTLTEKVEVLSTTAIDTTLPNKSNSTKILQHQQITVTVYDSGYYAIPGFKFIIDDDTAHPLYTKPLFLEVHTVPTDTSATKVKDIKSPLNEPFNWRWYIDYIYWGIGILVAVVAIAIWVMYQNKKKKNFVPEPEKPKIPPHILALASLEKIQRETIWKDGKIKEYYSEISDTVRLYIEERFNVNALESTTDEIMTAFRSQVVDKESKDKLQQLLTLSDLVKFAKQFPIEDEHNFSLQNAFDFVNGTKREEEVQLDASGTRIVDTYSPQQITEQINARQAAHAEQFAKTTTTQAKPAQTQEQVAPTTKKSNKWLVIILAVFGFIVLFCITYFVLNMVMGNLNDAGMEQTPNSSQTQPQTNNQGPQMLDAETRLDSVTVSEDNVTRQYRTLVNVMEAQLDVELVKSQSRPNLVNEVKLSDEYKELREHSGSVEFIYSDKTGKQMFITTVGPEDYLN
ncbi:MAG: hypothetical protein IT236_16370 [Bacteroidia bacterium]|nr:hypothetical protein [Bacteroidia bacterium]